MRRECGPAAACCQARVGLPRVSVLVSVTGCRSRVEGYMFAVLELLLAGGLSIWGCEAPRIEIPTPALTGILLDS